MKEPILESVLRGMRLRQVLPVIRAHPECRLLDVGCGWEARLLRAVEPHVREAVGIDFKAPPLERPKLRTVTMTLGQSLPFEDGAFDVVTALAVLEHLSHPVAMVGEIARVLRPGGQLVLTVPSHAAKPVLEFLAYRLHVVSEAEIRDHKRYYGRKSLAALLAPTNLRIDRHEYFQLGMNNYLCATKIP